MGSRLLHILVSAVGLGARQVVCLQYLELLKTRLGLRYQTGCGRGRASVLKRMEEMMKMLIQDLQKQENEFAEEQKKEPEKERGLI